MSLLQKILPGSLTKRKKHVNSEVDGEERHSLKHSKALAASRSKRRLVTDISDSDTSEFLMQSVSTAVNCDPVPTSFKTNSSFATQPKMPLGSVSPKSTRLHGSLSNTSGLLDRPQHTTTTPGSCNRPNPRSLFDKMHSSPSLPAGDTAAHGGSFAANASTVNLWRLPWTQQKVTMCPNCHRPRQRDRNVYISRATYVVPHVVPGSGMGDDMSEAGDNMSEGDSEGMNDSVNDSCTHCRCGVTGEDGAQVLPGDVADDAGQITPMYVVEARKPSANTQSEAVDVELESDDDEGVGCRQAYRLSQVSPLTSASLRRQPSQQLAVRAAGHSGSPASVPRSVSHWLHEQQVSETSTKSKNKRVS